MEYIGGYRNIHHVTASRVLAQVQLTKGINPIAKIKASGERRRPAVLIRSSPWKAGTAETPWHDIFDLDTGRVRYFGDHRVDHTVPVGTTQGNAVLLETLADHKALTAEQRASAVPLLLFAAVSRNGTHKGYVEFCGAAVIERATQIEQKAGARTYPNYRYDLAVLDLSKEDQQVDWSWIEARGNPELSTAETLEHAPHSWRQWVEHGHAVLPTVRHKSHRPVKAGFLDRPSTGGNHESEGRLPTPRHSQDLAAASLVWGRTSEALTPSVLMDRLGNLKAHQQNGRPSRHKALALLWSISRRATGRPRLAPWREFRDEVGSLMAEFNLPESSVTPEYPFWHLRTSRLWEVRGVPPEEENKPRAAAFNRSNPEAGMSQEAALLLEDEFVRSQAIAVLRETYLARADQHVLMARLGLAGYESAAGVEESAEAQDENRGPAPRRNTTSSRIVRDIALANDVKRLHHDCCQVCQLQLSTRFGTYSEAAHIRGLGRPHNGPDALSNLLVLCPNHHVQFDTLAIYVDADDAVRSTANGGIEGRLRRHHLHTISAAHLRYQRALCGRDTPAQAVPPTPIQNGPSITRT
ncbi:HNH endonuclease [Streptomyces sp. NBC_00342]|uniref:HNH endonuclease n=1 Tax=Streptomyces sp. NBC_00342 TaxID=2975718 RepID=UPI002E2ADFB7|nr:HNH endonuclease [Streptomyces sp. NBC_00342]